LQRGLGRAAEKQETDHVRREYVATWRLTGGGWVVLNATMLTIWLNGFDEHMSKASLRRVTEILDACGRGGE
jgi:hypothetical protein